MAPRLDLLLANRAYTDHSEPPPGPSGPITGGSGGLLAAVRPVIAPWDGSHGTTWIGAGMGQHDRDYVDDRGIEFIETPAGPLRHRRLFFDDPTWNGHYNEIANGTLWPMLHLAIQPLWELADYFPRPLEPELEHWAAYVTVNGTFAEAAMAEPGSDICWIHDYQLGLAPQMLRERGYTGRIGYFLHIPFPDIAIMRALDSENLTDVLRGFIEGLLGADIIGFQSEADARRFRTAASELSCAAPVGEDLQLAGRTVRATAYPVGIDVDATEQAAAEGALPDGVQQYVDDELPLVVGLERADYTKGIPERLHALAQAYRAGERFHFVGFSSPTREGVEAYHRLDDAVAEATEAASAAAREAGCHFEQSKHALSWEQVIGLLRDADVVFTSSLSDGMNLVPLQAAVAQASRPTDERGVIVAGIGAGVATAFADCIGEGLVTVDGLDPEAMAQTLAGVLAGNTASVSDTFIARVRARDARHWADTFLTDLGAVEA